MLDQNPADLGLRIRIKEELDRRSRTEGRWTRHEKWVAAGTVFGLLGFLAALAVVPGIPQWLGLEKRGQSERAGRPQSPSSQPDRIQGGGVSPPSVPSNPRPVLGVELRLLYGGPELRVFNEGDSLAQQINVDVIAWQATLYGVEFSRSIPVRDLIPNADFTIDQVFGQSEEESDSSGRHFEKNLFMRDEHLPISGYFVVTCSTCSHPRAWAFSQPRAKRDESGPVPFAKYYGVDHPWPLIEFEYPREKPKCCQCVNVPRGVGAEYQRYPHVLWSPPGKRQPSTD